MGIIIPINENARVKIIKDNFILQYKKKTKNKRIAWHTDGYFPTLEFLADEYINNTPYRVMRGTEDFERLLKLLEEAKTEMCNLIINNKSNE